MRTQFTHVFQTRNAALDHLHFIASVVSTMTIRHECLVGFEKYIPLVKIILSYLSLGISDSLTFGFRVRGFDFAPSSYYNDNYRKDKGDIVVKIIATFSDDCYCLEYSSLF